MALYNFPDSPSNADTVTINGITYTYNSTKGYWTSSAGSSGGGGASVSTSDSAPSSPSDGDLWYDTDDGGMFVYYADGSSNQWVEVIGQQGAAGAAGATGGAGTATVVANVTALMAISSPSAGDQAFVTATNTLYFYNGSGWYKIALINTTPSISGANASYDLATDGTATTVTIVATDPEGIPITYSIASDTSGNIATVAQGTGASTNVWTITPSTNTTYAGTFSLTFRASDGVNIAEAASSFTLVFSVANSKYTTGLFTSVGANNAVNNSFDDKSSSNHTITAAGDSHQTTFSPYRHGGYSMDFDGTGDWIDTPNHADFDLDGEFTIEFWVYIPNSYARTVQRVIAPNSSGYSTAPYISIGNDTGITGGPAMAGVLSATRAVGAGNPQMHANQTGSSATGTATLIPLNTWTHCALTRDSSNVVRMFQGGTLVATNTETNAFDFTYGNTVGARIGRSGWGAGETLGPANLKDFRIIKGTCLYTSNFTAPTETLTAVTNTKLLIFNKPYLKDEGETGHTLTVSGNPKIAPVGPFDEKEYTAASHLGSVHFDGTGDYLTSVSNGISNVGTGDFTFEGWFYLTANPSNFISILASRASGASTTGFVMAISASDFYVYSGAHIVQKSSAITPNRWYHWAYTRESGTHKLFLDGKLLDTDTTSRNYTEDTFWLGAKYDGSEYFTGNQADVRVVKGTAVYTANFTPPTAPLSAITNTSFLLHNTDAGIIDKSQTAGVVKLVGNTKSSTTQNKFLTSSMYFDGTGDYIQLDSQNIANFGTADFTAEGWFWVSSLPGSGTIYSIVDARSSGGNTTGWTMGLNASGQIYVYSGSQIVGAGGSVSTSTWHHWAFTRASGSMKQFLNGTQVGSTSTASHTFSDTKFRIAGSHSGGELFTGYQSDVRMTKGLARYTSNFTAPTAALAG